MIKDPFIQPRFVGPRFEGHTLPLSAAKDLAAYEELVTELAKHLWRKKKGGRQRVPKGFAEGFNLHLEKIDEGSSKLAIVAMMLTTGVEWFDVIPHEINEAKDLINAVIATEEGDALPTEFPKDLYSYFNRLGRSLEPGEFIEWAPDSPANKAVLTPEKRKRLVLGHRETYEAEVDVIGSVEELDAGKKTGTLRVEKGSVGFSFDDPFFADLKEALGVKTMCVRIQGIGVFDVNEKLSSIIEIDQLEQISHYPLASAIENLQTLSGGWLEGGGMAPSESDLESLVNEVSARFPDLLEYPSVVPTEEGNVVFEWIRPNLRIELEVNFPEKKLELYSTNLADSSFVEEVFSRDEWEIAYARVNQILGR
ncbi:MAG: hypothetical protein JJT96_15425 [Opitutales bacterium]|nr:hypothetical protein [Opitutales bacterium]